MHKGFTFEQYFDNLPIETEDGRQHFKATLRAATVAVTQLEEDRMDQHPTAPVKHLVQCNRFEVVIRGETAEWSCSLLESGIAPPPSIVVVLGDAPARAIPTHIRLVEDHEKQDEHPGSRGFGYHIDRYTITATAELDRENTHALVGPMGIRLAEGPVILSARP